MSDERAPPMLGLFVFFGDTFAAKRTEQKCG
jgi:hypothetical protein